MNEGKKIPRAEQEMVAADEIGPSKEEAAENYEVGYRKPPKNTRFKKGRSGNPSGRPRRPQDFDRELLREAGAFVTITENGRPVRISKHNVAIRQLVHKAMTGDLNALKTFVPLCRLAREKVVLMETQNAKDSERFKDPAQLTDEELIRIIVEGEEEKRREKEREAKQRKKDKGGN